ncbi:hypothetical protein [Dyadobacter sp. 32]|uniref:hypothetical protein n=1 Tax=Dyadobacter sp. 32 TaxID=538966 RepID=UPI0039C643B1
MKNQDPANCKASHWFGLDKHFSALVLASSKYFQSAAARADGTLIPNLYKALLVGGNPKNNEYYDTKILH